MSMLNKRWVIKNHNRNLPVFQRLLENRKHLKLDEKEDFHDPFLFANMHLAVERIYKAIENKERIIIFGDYDVDGISSTAILGHTLGKLGANFSYRLPHRVNDGYGLSEKFIDEFIEKDIKLIITVDCGISCKNEIKKAKDHGIDTIITDHHTIPKELPKEAIAILHPKLENSYPFKELTGAGVAFKLAQALLQEKNNHDEKLLDALLELALLGTIADLGPLTGENRLIVKRGLKNIHQTSLPGLRKLFEISGSEGKIDVQTIGFRIAPRINAAGRISSPYTPLFLLLAKSHSKEMEDLAHELQNLNLKRQDITEKALNEAKSALDNENLPPIIIAKNPDWHVGILGLIAGKLAEKYNRPAIIMQERDDVLVGSARSPHYFNIATTLTIMKDYLINFGGHAQAGGFSMHATNFTEFEGKLTSYAANQMKNIDLTPVLDIDCELREDEIDMQLLEDIEKLAPFGVQNQSPQFLLPDVFLENIQTVGKESKHLKFSVNIKNQKIGGIGFNLGDHINELSGKEKIDIVLQLEKDTWNSKTRLQLRLLDFRKAGH